MNTRNLLTFAGLIATLALAGPATAASTNEYDELQMVLGALYDDGGKSTAVGLLTKEAGTVHWAFFHSDGNRRASGSVSVQKDHLTPFIWDAATAADPTLAGMQGFLLFGFDKNGDASIEAAADGDNVTANAFLLDAGANDVAYLPAVDVTDTDLSENDTSKWTSSPVTKLDGTDGQTPDTSDKVDFQYLIDGAVDSGDKTTVYIFTADEVASSQSMTIYDGDGVSKAITVPLFNDHLNIIDLETISGVTGPFFGDGFVRWTVPQSVSGRDITVYIFVIVESPIFNAAQTLLGNFDES